MAVFLPFLGVIPGGRVATVLRNVLDVPFLPGAEWASCRIIDRGGASNPGYCSMQQPKSGII